MYICFQDISFVINDHTWHEHKHVGPTFFGIVRLIHDPAMTLRSDEGQQAQTARLFQRLLKLCAGRAGVPMEVMGLMLGEFVDDYTVKVVDVFAMPQSGTGVSVEAVDPVFQTKMLDMLKQCGR